MDEQLLDQLKSAAFLPSESGSLHKIDQLFSPSNESLTYLLDVDAFPASCYRSDPSVSLKYCDCFCPACADHNNNNNMDIYIYIRHLHEAFKKI